MPSKSDVSFKCPYSNQILQAIIKGPPPFGILAKPIARIPKNAASSTQACIPIGLTHIAEKVPLERS